MRALITHDRLAARHPVQKPVNANPAYRLEQVARHPGRLRRVVESRKTYLPGLNWRGWEELRRDDRRALWENDGGAAERSLNGNKGVDYLSKPSLAVVS